MSRRPTTDVEIGGHSIPAMSTVLISAYALHYDPNLYPDPDRFDPDRWATGGSAAALPSVSFMPFGSGLRSCIGERFALYEMITVLGVILRKWTLRRQPGVAVRPKLSFVMSPSANGVALVPR